MNKWIILISIIIIAAIIAVFAFLYISGFFIIPIKNDTFPEFYNYYAMLLRTHI